jgi:ligand-binding sensor domain-containing protein
MSPTQIKVEASSDDCLKFEAITEKDGLSYNFISCILQDHYGYMWIGTTANLTKYDGIDFTIYKNNPSDINSISNAEITCIYETSDYQLLVGTSSGLNRLNREDDTVNVYLTNDYIPPFLKT